MAVGGSNVKKRITVCYKTRVQLFLVPDTWDQLISNISSELDIVNFTLQTKQRAQVLSLDLVRDSDVLYVNTRDTPAEGSWIPLNVGGTRLLTTLSTLTREKNTMLARMFDKESKWRNKTDESGAYLIDRSPKYFIPLLDYLRHGEIIIDDNINPKGVLLEAKFFGFTELLPKLEELVKAHKKGSLEPLQRDDVVKAIISTPADAKLRFRGLDLSHADLSNLDLKNINFSGAKMCGTNLTKCDLYAAVFNKADMTGCILDEANCAGVKMEGVKLDGASMISCNFDDPHLKPCSLLGAQMRGVVLDNANLAEVNLRVVNLKGSSLKNVSLKGACLAGADLEDCDFTGADLENTNLRGANLDNVNFGEITSALHMTEITRHR